MNDITLKPCPACGSEDVVLLDEGKSVHCMLCRMVGPHGDNGENWNALPRQEDVKPDARRAERLHVAAIIAGGYVDYEIVNMPNAARFCVQFGDAVIAAVDAKEAK